VDLDILIEDARWHEVALETLAGDALTATFAHLVIRADACELSLLACDDERIADLNAEYRGKPAPTNVLSWPAEDLAAARSGEPPQPPRAGPDGMIALGDIAIAFDTCAREAEAAGKTLPAHVTHLIVHGTLHLLGYDHIRDRDAALMEGIETQILGKMGLDDPYRT
jgi:probable rRNA maturation factor